MPPEATIISDRKNISTKVVVLVSVVAVLILAAVVYGYIAWTKTRLAAEEAERLGTIAAAEEAYVAEMREIAKNTPRTFTLVPNALEVVIVPPPTPYDDTDIENYKAVSGQYTDEELRELAKSSIFEAATTDGTPVSAVLSQDSVTKSFWAIHDEIINLVIHYNEKYPEKPLYEAYPDVIGQPGIPTARYGVTASSVYPSVAATTPYLVALYLASVYPDQAEHYTKMGEEYAKQGIAFGWYDVDSMIAAESLVTQYFNALPQ